MRVYETNKTPCMPEVKRAWDNLASSFYGQKVSQHLVKDFETKLKMLIYTYLGHTNFEVALNMEYSSKGLIKISDAEVSKWFQAAIGLDWDE